MAIIAAAAVAQSLPAAADGCAGSVTPIEVGEQTIYIELDQYDVAGVPTVDFVIYLESNSLPDLQRGGWNPTHTYSDTCSTPSPDTLLV